MEIADLSQGGSEVVVGWEGVVFVAVVVPLRVEEFVLLALFCTNGRDAAAPLLDFRALFACVLVPTSSRAPASSGLLCFRGAEGGSMDGWLRAVVAIGTEDELEGVP